MTEHRDRDDDDTPADSPYARRRLLDDGAPAPKSLERRPPPMTPLPPNPTDRDLAHRFATVAEWHYEQHPADVARIEARFAALEKNVDEVLAQLKLVTQLRTPRQWPQHATFALVVVILFVVLGGHC